MVFSGDCSCCKTTNLFRPCFCFNNDNIRGVVFFVVWLSLVLSHYNEINFTNNSWMIRGLWKSLTFILLCVLLYLFKVESTLKINLRHPLKLRKCLRNTFNLPWWMYPTRPSGDLLYGKYDRQLSTFPRSVRCSLTPRRFAYFHSSGAPVFLDSLVLKYWHRQSGVRQNSLSWWPGHSSVPEDPARGSPSDQPWIGREEKQRWWVPCVLPTSSPLKGRL